MASGVETAQLNLVCCICGKPILEQYVMREGPIHVGTCLQVWEQDNNKAERDTVPCREAHSISELYDLEKELGSGGFAVVRAGTDKKDGSRWALKLIPQKLFEKYREQTLREVQIQASLNHPGVVKIREIVVTNKYFVVVLELLTGGELFERIVQKEKYDEVHARVIALELLHTLDYLHNHDIVHRDLKPENLLLTRPDDEADLKLCDFGFAIMTGGQRLTQSCGTPEYVAPEILNRQPYDEKVDMWSCGVILFVLLCGYPPFYSENERVLYRQICTATYEFSPDFWSEVSDEAKDLISRLLELDSAKRLSAGEALRHPWFAEVTQTPRDWGEAERKRQVEIGKSLAEQLRDRQQGKTLKSAHKELQRYHATRKLRRAVYAVLAAKHLAECQKLMA